MTAANDELYSLLVPLEPGAADPSAGLRGRGGPLRAVAADEAAPAWFEAVISWNGRQVPVMSFEELAGLARLEPGGRTGRHPECHWRPARRRLLWRAHRRLPTAGAGESVKSSSPPPGRPERERAGDLPIGMISDYPLIPDLEVIEDLIGEALGLARNPSRRTASAATAHPVGRGTAGNLFRYRSARAHPASGPSALKELERRAIITPNPTAVEPGPDGHGGGQEVQDPCESRWTARTAGPCEGPPRDLENVRQQRELLAQAGQIDFIAISWRSSWRSVLVAMVVPISRSIASMTARALSLGTWMLTRASYSE